MENIIFYVLLNLGTVIEIFEPVESVSGFLFSIHENKNFSYLNLFYVLLFILVVRRIVYYSNEAL